MREAFIVSAVRTPIGKIGGVFKDVTPDVLAEAVIKKAIEKSGFDASTIDEVVFGQTKQSADYPNIARVASLAAGVPESVPSYTVMRQCGSGLQAILNAYQIIMSNMGEVVLAGGVESMSNAPYYLRSARFGYKAGNALLVDSNTESQPKSQPEHIYGSFTMGMTAENISEKYNISRNEQDEYALLSQNRAMNAIEHGIFSDEIVPIKVTDKKGNVSIIDTDEGPRKTSMELLGKLKPVFKDGGTVTAGNSSTRNDGAAALMVASSDIIKNTGIKPLAKILGCCAVGVDPKLMGIGPIDAIKKVLKIANLTLEDIDVIEINEAFASQILAAVKELNIDLNKLNPNGGAIALGHPLGCSGARIITTLIHEMKRRNCKYGLGAICIAGGQGMAIVIENL